MSISVCDCTSLSFLLTESSGSPGKSTVKLPSTFLCLFHSSVCPKNGIAARTSTQEHISTLRIGLLLLKKLLEVTMRFSHDSAAQTTANPVTRVLSLNYRGCPIFCG